MESAQAFEKLVISLLNEISINQNKSIIIPTNYRDTGCDAILYDGIDSITEPVSCIIKYIQPHTTSIKILVDIIVKNIKTSNLEGTILIILSNNYSDEVKDDIVSRITTIFENKIILWDLSDINDRIDPDADYTGYIISPRQELIENILANNETIEEKNAQKKKNILNIKRAYKRQDLVLFLGAGISMDAGIPLWSGLVKKLLIHMINEKTSDAKLSESEQKTLNELAFNNTEDSPLTQMRYIRSAFSDEEYYRLVHAVLYEKSINVNTDLLNAITKICIPHRAYNGIKSVITYNFDDVVEKKFEYEGVEYNPVYTENDMSSLDKLNVYHVHGYLPSNIDFADNNINLIFSEEDYHKIYRDAYSWSNLIQLNAFRDSTCLFIGCSLTDPNLRRLLDVASRNDEKPRHYAFLPRNSFGVMEGTNKEILSLYQSIDDKIRESYYSQLGLNIIWIDDYNEIPIILKSLISK